MRIVESNPARIRASVVTLLAVIVVALMMTGCNRKYGRFAMDDHVSKAFRSGAVQPDYDYYYAGRDTMPYAILGIEKSYTLSSRLWTSFLPDAAQLQKMSRNIYGEVHYQPYGAVILAPDDKVIGVWYSNLFNHSVSVNPETREVQVLFENPEVSSRGCVGAPP